MGDIFASIKRGLEEAIAHQKGEKTGIRLFTPEEVNVKHVREKTGLTQEQFAATFGISLGTLRHWEGGATGDRMALHLSFSTPSQKSQVPC